MDSPTAPEVGAPTRWSAAAVSGFVLSWLGCTGLGAVLGLILGITGIVVTRGGRQRGMGLAIAALPISVVSAALGLGLAFSVIVGVRLIAFVPAQLPAVLGTQAGSTSEAAAALLELGSDDFQAEISVEKAEAWITKVRQKHGKLVEMVPAQVNPGGSTPEGNPYMSHEGKFVSGQANIKVVFDANTVWGKPKILDIQVDGVSPFDSD
jgi:hypothetical protein